MGRGRQKAKHTKVARELKYFSPSTDYNALERELGAVAPSESGEPDYEDKWADLYADEDGEVSEDAEPEADTDDEKGDGTGEGEAKPKGA